MGLIEGQRPYLRREAPPDDRGTQGRDKRKQYSWEKTPVEWRVEFDEDFGRYFKGIVTRQNDDGSETPLRAYGIGFRTYRKNEQWPPLNIAIATSRLNGLATQAGYELGEPPVLVEDSGELFQERPTSTLWLYLKETPGVDLTRKSTGPRSSALFDKQIANPLRVASYDFPEEDEGRDLHELVYERILSKRVGRRAGAPEQGIPSVEGMERETSGAKEAKDTSLQERGDLAKARAVLQTIVNAHENTLTETTPLDRVGIYSIDQVRQAERLVAQAIIDKDSKGGSKERKYKKSVVKNTPQGQLNLRLREETWMKEGLELHFNANGSGSLLLTNRYALEEPKECIIRPEGFYDYRHGERAATLSTLERAENEASQLRDKRMMWQGLRWMSANMLAWDNPNTIMPEELGSVPLRNRSNNNR